MEPSPNNPAPGHSPRGMDPEEDRTLGGYLRRHDRPPAFQGPDGYPYTVSMEVEKGPDLRAPFMGYLVFPRWAETGGGIIGHLETPTILHGKSREEVEAGLEDLTLPEVRALLDTAAADRQTES